MLELIITSSILILVIILLRFLFENKISRRFRYAMWGIVLLRLFIPVQLFSSPVSILNVINEDTIIVRNELMTQTEVEYTPSVSGNFIDPNSTDIQPAQPTPTQNNNVNANITNTSDIEPSRPSLISPENILFTVWLTGAIGVALWFILSNFKLYKTLRKYRSRVDIKGSRLPVYVVDGLLSPCLFGIFKPAIYLTPKAMESKDSINHVMTHELTHYIQKDHLWALLRGACVAVYWFNPLVWIAAWLSRYDCELSCDEAAVIGMGEETRIDYGRTLITMISIKRKPETVLCAATTMSSGATKIKKRLEMIIDNKKSVIPALLISIFLIIIVACATFTSALNTDNYDNINTDDYDNINTDNNDKINTDDSIDVQTPRLEVRALSIRHDGYASPIGADDLEFTIRVGDETTLLALLEPLGVIDEITWVIDDVNIIEIIYIDLDTTKATIKAINSGTTKLTVFVANLIETVTIRVVESDFSNIHIQNIQAIFYEKPSDNFFVIGFITENSQQPFYYVPDDDVINTLTNYLDEALSRDELPDYAIRGRGTPLGFFIVYNDVQWEVRSHGILMSYNPDLAEYVLIYSIEATEILGKLMSDIGVVPFSPIMIRNIVLAEIEVRNTGIDGFYSQVIADTDNKLSDIEAILSNSEHLEPPACPFSDVFLKLTLSTGEEVLLAMASDSCNVFFFNGQYFEFKVPGNVFWYEFFTDHMPIAVGDN